MPTDTPEPMKIEPIEIERLLLDPDNPRLAHVDVSKGPEGLVKAMWQEMAVSEVALSIAENGFFPEEPLLAIPAKGSSKKDPHYIVVEGNRRLTAVLLLTDDSLRARVKATDLPKLTASQRRRLGYLPVAVYPDREALWEYFGFRHVNGPKEWDALAKATYVAQVRRNLGIDLDTIARKIGDQHSTVKRFYRGYVLLEQAENESLFARENRVRNRLHFSHLYTAVAYPDIQKFLGVTEENSLVENPVNRSHFPQLAELMTWLFGDKSRDRDPIVRKQNPHLSMLRDVIADRSALNALRSGISLERSYAISLGDSRRFEESLINAKDALQEVRGTVTTGYKGDQQPLSSMEGIHKLTTVILSEMRQIAERRK